MAKSVQVVRPCGSSAPSRVRLGLLLAAGLVMLPLSLANGQGGGGGKTVSVEEYEGWRQYSVHCARCHGQDVLGNPVAADLLKTTASGGSSADQAAFVKVVREGRPSRGMPGLEGSMTPEQMAAVYAYVKGRADKKIPPGRPSKPAK
jgi:mono/diheme cytochrome c family protein